MTNLAFPAPAPVLLPIAGSDALFPVRRIFCVGRNYAEHAREMGLDPEKKHPFFFNKPADAAIPSGRTIPFPVETENLHHEAELVVAIGKAGTDIAAEDTAAHIWGYASGNDLTRRDLQAQAKEDRRPWCMAKGFDNSAVIGALHPASEVGDMTTGRISCTVDGEIRQDSDLVEMIWPTANIIAFLSRLVTLQPGDLIMTGTPAGVGQITPGQSCTVTVEGLSPAEVSFA
ncbi:fumarylpyruvate hydrolase [Shimia gijangensis]|uniref:Fumarylpyruvate hydrolase n=1 Tax=Shimia gijangensis TaxID=1470563 RepID=A0A1M6KKF2_9RHOB|nr:fumarylacetoacetate hydrolase family protein [Shimia gijangensis]SHJ59444.1 fumarylpyruvate hydrolase [Shimia gijangensis]